MMGADADAVRLFCTFRLDGHLFGVDIHDVKEVTRELAYTRIAHAPDEVLGLVNIRGHIQLVLDLRLLLGISALPRSQDSRLVLFKAIAGNSFGVVVDAISDICAIPTIQIEDFSAVDQRLPTSYLRRIDLISAIGKLPKELLVVLNPRKFLPIVEESFTPAI